MKKDSGASDVVWNGEGPGYKLNATGEEKHGASFKEEENAHKEEKARRGMPPIPGCTRTLGGRGFTHDFIMGKKKGRNLEVRNG